MDSLETMGYRYRRYFFQEGEVTIKPLTLMNLLWQYLNVTGGAEARRLVMQGGVKFNDEMMTDLERLHQPLPTEDLTVRVGKWREAKLEGGQVVDVITLR